MSSSCDSEVVGDVLKIIQPSYSYSRGIYWGSLSWRQRAKHAQEIDSQELRKELIQVFPSWKQPWVILVKWWQQCCIPGAGIFAQSVIMMAWGTLKVLFQRYDPACFKDNTTCSKGTIYAINYAMMGAIMVGQMVMGVAADWLGRYQAMVTNSLVMATALLAIVLGIFPKELDSHFAPFLVIMFVVYGIGVGGEYPITATMAMERNSALRGHYPQRADALHRGRGVTLTFSMQGWGNLFSQVLCLVLYMILEHAGANISITTHVVFRVPFALTCLATFWLAYHRLKTGRAASKTLEQSKRLANIKGYDFRSIPPLLKYSWHRLFATCSLWFICNVVFYGIKLHQAEVLKPMLKNPNSFVEMMDLNIKSIGVGIAGYHLAAFTVDNKLYGRRKQIIVGDLACAISMFVPWMFYDFYTSPRGLVHFQYAYLALTFFTQFGSNCVTFLVAAELYPTSVRATAHGLGAMCGKLGALLVGIAFNYIKGRNTLLFFWIPSLIAVVIAFVFLPDTTGLDLREQERRWTYVTTGRAAMYHGPAVHPVHLSYWERWIGVGAQYDAQQNVSDRVTEMREEWDANPQLRDEFPEAIKKLFVEYPPDDFDLVCAVTDGSDDRPSVRLEAFI